MKFLALFIIFFTNQNYAVELPVYSAKYKLEINGIFVANDKKILIKNSDNSYLYTSNVNSTWLLSLFKKYSIKYTSKFVINNLGLNSTSYEMIKDENDKIKENTILIINSASKTVLNTANNKIYPANTGNIIDKLNRILALHYDILNAPKKLIYNYQIATNKKIKLQSFYNHGITNITINDKTIKVIKVMAKNKDSNKKTIIYFAIDKKYAPILIKHNRKNKEYIYTLTNISF